jgi:hypothetical protein
MPTTGPHQIHNHMTGDDPTQNVLDIVQAESKYQDGMREAQAKLDAAAIQSLNAIRDAETNRLDQLAGQRQRFEKQIADMLAASVTEKSSLVASQLLQIQSTFGDRISKLEEFRLLSTGRSSVADPQLASSLDALNKSITATQDHFTSALTELSEKTTGAMNNMAKAITTLQDTTTRGGARELGRHEMIAWIVAAAGFVTTVATGIALFTHLAPPIGHLTGG